MSFAFSKSTPATGAAAIFNLKELLKTQGWTVISSSDGTTYNASADQITVSGTGAGGMENNSAWFNIRSPAGVGGIVYLIQRGTTNLVWRMKVSRGAGFVGGSPSATQVPSATDETILTGGGTDASPTFQTFFTTDNIYRWNVGADNATPYTFWAGAFPTGGGAAGATLILDYVAGAEPTDAYKYISIMSTSATQAFQSTGNQSCGETFATTSFRVASTVASATPATWTDFAMMGFVSVLVGGSPVPVGIPTNPATSKDETFPIPLLRRQALANPGWKGVTSLIKWCGTLRTTGDALTINSTRDRIVFGIINLPWDGTVPTV